MTEEEARGIIAELTHEEKVILYELLIRLRKPKQDPDQRETTA